MSPKNETSDSACTGPVSATSVNIGDDGEQLGNCFFCGQLTTLCCNFCQNIFYCSKDCYVIHRPKDYCFPFIVKCDPKVGRYLVASRDIGPCEPILTEVPAVMGPYTPPTTPLCLSCYSPVDLTNPYHCPRCNLPLCNLVCASSEVHQQECQYAASKNAKFDMTNMESTKAFFSSITVLRMLLTRKNKPQIYSRIMNLMDHSQERQAEGQYLCTSMKVNIMSFLLNQFGSVEFTEQEIDRCIGILKVNGMKLENGGLKQTPGVILYPIYCLINSACISNTNYIKTPSLELQLRSQIGIKKGEEITTRYVSSTLGNNRRREYLRKYWYFDCLCDRCSDSSELNTHMSSVNCSACRRGLLVKTKPLDYQSDWKCNNCGNIVSTNVVDAEVDRLEQMMNDVDMSDPEKLEELLWRLSDGTILHPQHYIILELSHSLIFAYKSSDAVSLTRPQMDRKIQLCHLVLNVLGKVDPGFTAWQGKILNELSNTLLLISRSDYNKKIINMVAYKKRIYKCMKNVALAKKCINLGFSGPQ